MPIKHHWSDAESTDRARRPAASSNRRGNLENSHTVQMPRRRQESALQTLRHQNTKQSTKLTQCAGSLCELDPVFEKSQYLKYIEIFLLGRLNPQVHNPSHWKPPGANISLENPTNRSVSTVVHRTSSREQKKESSTCAL